MTARLRLLDKTSQPHVCILRAIAESRRWCLVALVAVGIVLLTGCANSETSTPAASPEQTVEHTIPPSNPEPSLTLAPTFIPSRTQVSPSLRRPTPTIDTITPTATPQKQALTTPHPPESTALPPEDAVADVFPDAPDRDLYELARALRLKTSDPISPVVNEEPISYAQGRRDTFWFIDLDDVRAYTSQAILRLVTPHAYWYVQDGVNVSQKVLEESARAFEQEIYPRVTATFGSEWVPGVDNDPHLTVVHARLGRHSYFSTADEYPLEVHQHSNEREMVYMSTDVLDPGSREYLAVLSHELQHAVHWNGDRTEETWINEGLSEVATVVAGTRYSGYIGARDVEMFLQAPSISLLHWPLEDSTLPYYGAAFLFLDYLATHYGTRESLGQLVREPLDGTRGIESYLSGLGYDLTFRDVFADWVVASYLDQPGDGLYSYPDGDVNVSVSHRMGKFGERESSIPQYSAEYTAVDIVKEDILVSFHGQKHATLLPVPLEGEGCWWSNRGDSISSTLTRSLDLSRLREAVLSYDAWFEIEDGWDYAYVEVSTDVGSTWDILEAPSSSPENPVGNSYGPGYTGSSGGWLREQVDLAPYLGQQVELRFHYVTDAAIDDTGFCVRDILLKITHDSTDARSQAGEIELSGNRRGDGWQAEGFFWTDNRVPQDYVVQVIEVGDGTRVREIELDEANWGEVLIQGLEDLDELVIVVAALAPKTLQPASYTLIVAPGS